MADDDVLAVHGLHSRTKVAQCRLYILTRDMLGTTVESVLRSGTNPAELGDR